ncbi:MAG: hypothetical protein U0R24_15430 [Solirubrobacterales bacterium]
MAIRSATARITEVDGQAAVSLVAVIPGLVILALVAAQFALAGHAALSAANAARAAARASYIGSDPADAARAALPPSFRERAEVSARGDRAEVEVEAPRALPFFPVIDVTGTAQLAPDEGIGDG